MMMRAHINTPNTKLDIAADSMDEDIMSILSDTELASLGCVIRPRMNENRPAMEPAIKACTCNSARLPQTRAFRVGL
jgi:hypothetical protein